MCFYFARASDHSLLWLSNTRFQGSVEYSVRSRCLMAGRYVVPFRRRNVTTIFVKVLAPGWQFWKSARDPLLSSDTICARKMSSCCWARINLLTQPRGALDTVRVDLPSMSHASDVDQRSWTMSVFHRNADTQPESRWAVLLAEASKSKPMVPACNK